jgi:hypothetical protein
VVIIGGVYKNHEGNRCKRETSGSTDFCSLGWFACNDSFFKKKLFLKYLSQSLCIYTCINRLKLRRCGGKPLAMACRPLPSSTKWTAKALISVQLAAVWQIAWERNHCPFKCPSW